MGKPYKNLPMVGVSGFVSILSQKGRKLWFVSVKPSAATLIRVAIDFSNPATEKTGDRIAVTGFVILYIFF